MHADIQIDIYPQNIYSRKYDSIYLIKYSIISHCLGVCHACALTDILLIPIKCPLQLLHKRSIQTLLALPTP